MVADMPDYKKSVAKKLSSYDLAAIGYEMKDQLYTPAYMKLGLVAKISSHLEMLLAMKDYRSSLYVPDESRKIFNSLEKVAALEVLNKEFSDLTQSIFSELKPIAPFYDASVLTNRVVY